MSNKGVDLEVRAKDSATPVIKGVATSVSGITPEVNKAGTAADVAFAKIKDGSQQAGAGVDGLAKKFDAAKTQVAAFAGINIGSGMVKDAIATADAFNNLQARIKLATGSGEAFNSSFKEVAAIAQRTGSNLEQTGILFGKLTDAGKSAGLSTQAAITQALGLTETINQAIQLSGGSAEASKAAITQLIQGLQSGVLRGDEFNSVMEQSPRLSKALADSLGVTTGELRKMAEAGTLSADTVIKGLKGQSAVLAAEFATLPSTVGRSVEKLQTQWMLYIGDLDKSQGITSKVAQGLDLLAGNLNGVLQTAQTGAAVWLGYNALQKLAGDGAAVTAAKVTTQAVASTEAAVATRAHGAAATKAAVDVRSYGAAAGATGAQIAAANAVGSVGAVGGLRATTSAVAGLLGKLGAIGAVAYAGYEVLQLAFTAGDSLLKKWAGLSSAEDALSASDKRYADTLKESQAAQEAQTAAKQAAIDKTFGLTKESALLVGKFGELLKAGDSASEAIGKIGKDFDLSTVPGIQAAGSVLDKLLADGKITAAQFQTAWSDALKGQDLAEFDVKARAAFASTARGALELQQALDAGVREAIKRTGLDFEVISGGMGKAARSALNDTDAIIAGLDRLKAQGVDTGQALTASLSKGINTADSVKALEVVKAQIEQVRSALGNTVADGLLDQAKTKALELKTALESTTPGIQSVAEAMKQLGVTSDVEFKAVAEKSKTAFDAMRDSGSASARELQEAFKKVASDAIAANNGVAPAWVTTEAAVRGVTIAVDANGKATLDSAAKSKQAIGEVTQAFDAQAAAANKAAIAAMNGKYARPGEDPTGQAADDADRTKRLTGQNFVNTDYMFSVQEAAKAGNFDGFEEGPLRNFIKTSRDNKAKFLKMIGVNSVQSLEDDLKWERIAKTAEDALNARKQKKKVDDAQGLNANAADDKRSTATGSTGSTTSERSSSSSGSSRAVYVNINTPKGPERVYTDDMGAQALVRSLAAASQSAR